MRKYIYITKELKKEKTKAGYVFYAFSAALSFALSGAILLIFHAQFVHFIIAWSVCIITIFIRSRMS